MSTAVPKSGDLTSHGKCPCAEQHKRLFKWGAAACPLPTTLFFPITQSLSISPIIHGRLFPLQILAWQLPPLPQPSTMVPLFSVPAFFILFRETLEASIILSVMLTLINKIVDDPSTLTRLKRQVWLGVTIGVALCMVTAAVFLSLYYTVAKKAWENSEPLWEGILGLIAVVLITIMAFSMIRVDTWRSKWEKKLTKVTVEALNKQEEVETKTSKYALFLIPFTVVIREGVEAVIFLGGIGLEGSAAAYPIPAVIGALCGVLVGYLLYKGGNRVAFKYFLGAATVLLLVIAAGLFTGSVHELEEYTHNESFLWQLKCCDQDGDGIWKLLNAVVGWRNEATKGTLSSYIVYWVFVIVTFMLLRMKWNREAELSAEETTPVVPV